MTVSSSVIIIIIVLVFAFYLIYSQNSRSKYPSQISQFIPQLSCPPCQKCELYKQQLADSSTSNPTPCDQHLHSHPHPHSKSSIINVNTNQDPYSDPIKKQDLYTMYDPLTYPQLRLPREILEKYNEYHEKNGSYPPFNQATQSMFDNPILNGILIKQSDDNEPFGDNIPTSVPLFRVKSAKNSNRYFYYIVDQRYQSKIELKIPLDHVKINGIRYDNADYYGLPELYEGDMIENIAIYPNTKFKILMYRTYHFP